MDKLQALQKRKSAIFRANDTIVRAYSYFGGERRNNLANLASQSLLKIETEEQSSEPGPLHSWIRFIDAKKGEIFFTTLYTLVMVYIYFDMAYCEFNFQFVKDCHTLFADYTFLNETSGLRQIAGLGVTMTRGTASVLMFNFSTILLTMCRNLLTFLRETFLYKYIPFDGAVSFHKYIALCAFVMSCKLVCAN